MRRLFYLFGIFDGGEGAFKLTVIICQVNHSIRFNANIIFAAVVNNNGDFLWNPN